MISTHPKNIFIKLGSFIQLYSGENNTKIETTNWLSFEIPNWNLSQFDHSKKSKIHSSKSWWIQNNLGTIGTHRILGSRKRIHWNSLRINPISSVIEGIKLRMIHMYLMNVSNIVIFHMLVVSVLGYRVHLAFFLIICWGFQHSAPNLRSGPTKKEVLHLCSHAFHTLSQLSICSPSNQRSCRPQFHGFFSGRWPN